MRALAAGILFAIILFGVGFMLGTIRVVWLEPALGQMGALLLELPMMLTIAWVSARWIVVRLDPDTPKARAIVAGLGFTLLMVAEFVLGMVMLGMTPAGYLGALAEARGMIGLAAQIFAGTMPLWVKGWA